MNTITPPTAKKITEQLKKHGDVRIDDYYWLNDRDNPEVISYLEEEAAYYEGMTAHLKDLKDSLFLEMKSRIKEDDASVPYKQNGYWYSTRFVKGKEYPIYSRRKGSLEAMEQVMFNCNAMASGHEFFDLGGIAVSMDNRLAAFGTDTVSRRQYTIQIKDL